MSLVNLVREQGLAVITLDRPDKMNAMTTAMRRSLGALLDEVADDRQVKGVLIRANGRAFCAGADLSDRPDSPMAWRERILLAQAQHLKIIRMQKPVIAAVQGLAVGGGASLAMACDVMLMASDARLVFPFVRLGVVPDGGAAALLQAKTSPAVALDVLLSAGEIGAGEAERLGLTRRVVPPADLDAAARALGAALLALPADALMLTKSLIAQRWTSRLEASLAHEAEAFALATSTDDHRRAIEALGRKTSN